MPNQIINGYGSLEPIYGYPTTGCNGGYVVQVNPCPTAQPTMTLQLPKPPCVPMGTC
jgi:hypothetical protein